MSSTFAEIASIVLLIAAAGVVTLAQVALNWASRLKLQRLAEHGSSGAQSCLRLLEAPEEASSSLRFVVALLSVFAAVLGGLTLAPKIETGLGAISFGSDTFDRYLAFSLAVGSITTLSIFIGDILPKRLALARPEGVASTMGGFMATLCAIFGPIVSIMNRISEWFLAAAGVRPAKEPVVTEEEVKELIEQGTQEGVFEKAEETIMKRALRLGDQKIHDIMTPRPQLTCLDMKESYEANLQRMLESPHSYFPVHRGNPDHITGLISVKHLWTSMARGERIPMEEAQTKPLFVMEKISALGALELFKQSGKHIAIVVDEHGGLSGIVTVNDILQALVGDLPTTNSGEKPSAIQRQDGTWLVDGMISIDEFKDLFKIQSLPEDKQGTYQTLAGFIMFQMGRVPREADRFSAKGFTFEVLDMDGKRIDKVLVTAPKNSKSGGAGRG